MSNAADLWKRYTSWLEKTAPAIYANLAPPAEDAHIDELERIVGAELPSGVREVWRLNDGQSVTMTVRSSVKAPACVPSLSVLSVNESQIAWREWEELRTDTDADMLTELNGACTPVDPERVKKLYTSPGWIPLWADPWRADFIGPDLDPAPGGTRGQIINFGRDEEHHAVLAESFEHLLELLLTEIETGAWQPSVRVYEGAALQWLGDPDEDNLFYSLHARREVRDAGDDPGELVAAAQQRGARGELEHAILLVERAAAAGAPEVATEPLTDMLREKRARRRADRAARRASALIYEAGASDDDREHADAVLAAELELLPDHAELLADRAMLRSYHQHRFEQSLPLFERALEAAPRNVNLLGWYAYTLCALGHRDAPEAVERALELAGDDAAEASNRVECLLYLYALRGDAASLAALRRSVDAGDRTEGWDFSPVFARAAASADAGRLEQLAAVANGEKDASELDDWADWRAAKS